MTDTRSVHEEEAIEVIDGSVALSAVDRAAIDMQVATARKYPRSIDKSLKEAQTLATLDEETAGSMFYALPRDGKMIEGPSARLAEVMAYAWGNLRADADIVSEDRTHITAMGTCFDLEKNVAIRVRVKRRITNKAGVRYKDDMIGVTGNAAISIALRNAVFKVVPAALVRRVYQAARAASLGQGGTMGQKRAKALAWFAKLGVSEGDVFRVLGVRGLDDIGEDQLITLRGLVNAIQDGETTVEQTFAPPKGERSQESKDLAATLERAANGGMAEPEPKPQPQAAPAPATLDLRSFQHYAAGYKAVMGEAPYHESMRAFSHDDSGRSDSVNPDQYDLALTTLHAAARAASKAPFPSRRAFAEATDMRRDELLETIPALEQSIDDAEALRQTYLGEVPVEKALVTALRLYYARLSDLAWTGETGPEAAHSNGDLFGSGRSTEGR